MKHEIKFISYDGKYPNLCSGILTLEIDGKTVTFGSDNRCDYDRFWISGGCCGFDSRLNENYIETDEWQFDDDEYFPDEYLDCYGEIKALFNQNVEFGCCGGCL